MLKPDRPCDGYQHCRHNKNLLMVHLIFVTKYRKSLFSGEFKNNVKQHIYDACLRKHWYIRRMETDRDHIHILLQYTPTDSVSGIVSYLKQYSTFYAWQKWRGFLRRHYWKERTLWSDGYFACSIGNVSKDVVEHYIENQR